MSSMKLLSVLSILFISGLICLSKWIELCVWLLYQGLFGNKGVEYCWFSCDGVIAVVMLTSLRSGNFVEIVLDIWCFFVISWIIFFTVYTHYIGTSFFSATILCIWLFVHFTFRGSWVQNVLYGHIGYVALHAQGNIIFDV